MFPRHHAWVWQVWLGGLGTWAGVNLQPPSHHAALPCPPAHRFAAQHSRAVHHPPRRPRTRPLPRPPTHLHVLVAPLEAARLCGGGEVVCVPPHAPLPAEAVAVAVDGHAEAPRLGRGHLQAALEEGGSRSGMVMCGRAGVWPRAGVGEGCRRGNGDAWVGWVVATAVRVAGGEGWVTPHQILWGCGLGGSGGGGHLASCPSSCRPAAHLETLVGLAGVEVEHKHQRPTLSHQHLQTGRQAGRRQEEVKVVKPMVKPKHPLGAGKKSACWAGKRRAQATSTHVMTGS